jgi:hypothetical protein
VGLKAVSITPRSGSKLTHQPAALERFFGIGQARVRRKALAETRRENRSIFTEIIFHIPTRHEHGLQFTRNPLTFSSDFGFGLQ